MKVTLQLTSACVLAAFLTSCSTTNSSSTTGTGSTTGTVNTTAQDQYAGIEDELKTIKEARFAYTVDGALKGAATGAATGAVTAAITGGNVRDSAIAGGIGGGMAGGLMGFRTGDEKGNEKVEQKRSQKEKEIQVKKETEVAKESNKAALTAIAKLRGGLKSATNPKVLAKIKADATKLAKETRGKITEGEAILSDEGTSKISAYRGFEKELIKMKESVEMLEQIVKDSSAQKLA
jgi:hypothetical protein